ncbi:phosphatase PAP2 family protein [Natranaeroarchaeum sulfidigenes]|uniref:Membrane-associated phospholipid phosphatase n=1 Tax=Natranaeroarchaeum sulfidigenes TaxID=2784880 RepID=A0A897MRT6_9EURY|nr:phosphatase PAP2 family protein [Natranaeroarchaeum sulfidigenes]QSG01679.1 Membrane-associated phospholipid phosphatase [Natranaeroarchaeum sulfidigenes]
MSRGVGVTEFVREFVPDGFSFVGRLLALPGDIEVAALVITVIFAFGVRQQIQTGDRERLCSRRTITLIAVVFGGLSLAIVLKSAFGLPRPPVELQATPRSGEGFPSGHTMTATVLWGALALWGRVWTHRGRWAVAAALISLVAFSRLALGVHYLVDVLASVAFGMAYLYAMWSFVRADAMRAFTIAIVLSVLAAVASGGSTDGLLALVGTVGCFAGWRVAEHEVVRKRVFTIALKLDRRLSASGNPEE